MANVILPQDQTAVDQSRRFLRIWTAFFDAVAKRLNTGQVTSFTVAGVPSAVTYGAGATIFVSDETGGAVLAFSDGTQWRRVTDRAVIS